MKKLESLVPFVVVGIIVAGIIGYMSLEKSKSQDIPSPTVETTTNEPIKNEEVEKTENNGESPETPTVNSEVRETIETPYQNLGTEIPEKYRNMKQTVHNLFGMLIDLSNGTITKIEHNNKDKARIIVTDRWHQISPADQEVVKMKLGRSIHTILSGVNVIGENEPLEVNFINSDGDLVTQYISRTPF